MIADRIRDFVDRDWAAARQAKDRYWLERFTRLGPEEAFRVAEELRRQALEMSPGWPSTDERRHDLETHIRVGRLLRRVRPARGR